MEWDFKDFASCWDSSSADQKEEDSDLAALVGFTISQSQRNASPASSSLVDLKLGADVADAGTGHLYCNTPMSKLQKEPIKLTHVSSSSSSSPPPPSSSSSSRRVSNNGSDRHKASCLVDGCKADLGRCREYHRRHRVCELHSKAPVVILRGEKKRFCQQCSRFHYLVEFDEVKRSCRKRLNGHNQRRRKPKPESFYFSSTNFLTSFKGPRILQFSNPQLCAATNVRGMWPAEANRHQWLRAIDQRSPSNSFNIGGDEPFLFLQTNDPKVAAGNRAAPQAFMCQQPFPTAAAAASPSESRKGGHIRSSDGMTRGIDSGCALYLLSSHPSQNSATALNHMVQSNVTTHHPGQLLDSRLQTNGFSEFSWSPDLEDKPVNPEMMFLMGHDGFLDNGAQMHPILLE